MFEGLGGKIEEAYYAFGEYDAVIIAEFPNNVSAAALSLALNAGGAAAIKTTPLMTIDEGLEAIKLAGGASYQPPSA